MIKSKYLKSILYVIPITLLLLQSSIDIVIAQQEDNNGESEDKPANLDSSHSKPFVPFFNSWWVDGILVTGIILISSIIIYYIFNFFLDKTARSLNLDRAELKGIRSVSKMILIVISITIIIFQFSNVSGVIASAVSVAAGTIIGFSSRNTISNAIAGILLLSSRPFNIGDRIHTTEENQLIGDVVEITLLYTKIKTVKNELVAIPNQTLLQRQIINYSGLQNLVISVQVTLTYDKDRMKIESLMVEAALITEGIISEKNMPFVFLSGFSHYGAIYELRSFTNKPNEFFKIQSDLRKNIFDMFHKNNIDMTVPDA
ncbi:MAG: mechanosensitive ion channel family protein [Candidatus Nitrosocosmicus sp.]